MFFFKKRIYLSLFVDRKKNVMKNRKQAEKKISLNKLQMVRISNPKIIKGGGVNLNFEEEQPGTGRTTSVTCV